VLLFRSDNDHRVLDADADMHYAFSMHGQPTQHNPLTNAARDALAVAREAKSPTLERIALIGMMISTGLTAVIGGFQLFHMLKRDLKEKEHGGHAVPASPPPEPPRHSDPATAAMPPDDRQGRWSQREQHATHRHAYGNQR
jgi:hypothetical protein